ncbi:MAG: RNase P modulator RnpM [Bacillota bacterium]
MLKKKKIPLRKCLGCNEMKPKKELIRVVRSPEGKVSVDKTGKANGRGCYICPNLKCLESASKSKRIQAALEVPVENDLYENLREQIPEDVNEG